MTTPNPVREHFDTQAASYRQSSAGTWWQLLRRRESRAVMAMLDVQRGERVLDAGSGAGYYSELLAAADARVTALDFSRAMLDALAARLEIETLEGDLAQVSLEPRFDLIVVAGALEFVSDPAAALANLRRGLDPHGPGVVVVLAPRDSLVGRVYRLFHRRHGFAIRLFTREGLTDLGLQAGGFRVDAISRATFNWVVRYRRVV